MANQIGITPRKSVVQVRFSGYGKALAYYNDSYDLQPGDLVYVSGKLEGQRGRVTEVNYNFKIKLSDYQRVIALVDTRVHGSFIWQVPTSSPLTMGRCQSVRCAAGSWLRSRRKKNTPAAVMILPSCCPISMAWE